MDEGWIKIHRSITEGNLWFSEPFDRSRAWIDLLLMADEEGRVSVNFWGLTKRWKWQPYKTRLFLKLLVKNHYIDKEDTSSTTIDIFIKNYEEYRCDG